MFEVREINTDTKMSSFENFEEAKEYAGSLKKFFINSSANYLIVKIETVWSTQTLDELLKDI